VDGFEVVKAVESCGSRSGETAYDVMIANCGQLPKGEQSAITRVTWAVALRTAHLQ
jgi:peptidyl-prolyl isomerase F (cyclophilin D)